MFRTGSGKGELVGHGLVRCCGTDSIARQASLEWNCRTEYKDVPPALAFDEQLSHLRGLPVKTEPGYIELVGMEAQLHELAQVEHRLESGAPLEAGTPLELGGINVGHPSVPGCSNTYQDQNR